jgi:hypothetical protein
MGSKAHVSMSNDFGDKYPWNDNGEVEVPSPKLMISA